MILYTNGDSFVAGIGLSMPGIKGFPGYFSLGPWEDPNYPLKVSDWFNRSTKRLNLSLDDIKAIERSRAFPYKISKSLNIPLIDNSLGGSSFYRITRTSLVDLLKIKQEHPGESIVAIIGLTSPARSEVAYTDNNKPCWAEVHFGPKGNNVPGVDSIMCYKLEYEQSYHQLTIFFQNIILLREFCLKNNIKLFLTGPEWSELAFPYDDYPDLKLLRDYIGNIFDVSMTAEAMSLEKPLLPCGHYREEVHDLVSEKFIKMIKEL